LIERFFCPHPLNLRATLIRVRIPMMSVGRPRWRSAPDIRADQIRQRRGEVHLDIGGNLERDDLRRVGSRRVLPSIRSVDDHPLADEIGFAHRRRQPAFPGAAKLALAVTISGRLPPPVFLDDSSIRVTPGRDQIGIAGRLRPEDASSGLNRTLGTRPRPSSQLAEERRGPARLQTFGTSREGGERTPRLTGVGPSRQIRRIFPYRTFLKVFNLPIKLHPMMFRPLEYR
jgi:hypothetical protein